MASGDLLVVAGEASGDLKAARLLSELRGLGFAERAFGLGGDELAAAGLERVAESSEISVVGITEVLRILGRARQIFAELLAEVDRRGARTAILVDFPDFNLRLARELQRRGVRVIYYVSPQVWAWRRGRVRTIARVVDRMLVVFPFEVDFYRRHGVEVVHVGHPLVDEVPRLEGAWDREPRGPDGPFHVSLLPGSRRSEVRVLLPILLDAAALLAAELPARFSLIRAPSLRPEEFESEVARAGVDLEVVSKDRFDTLASSHLALCAAGTATLEVGLLGTPMVVVHRVAVWSYLVALALVELEHASLVNLVLGEAVVPELLQYRARPRSIARRAVEVVSRPERIAAMRARLAELRPLIGPPGASRRAASEVLKLVGEVGGSSPEPRG